MTTLTVIPHDIIRAAFSQRAELLLAFLQCHLYNTGTDHLRCSCGKILEKSGDFW